MPRVQGVRFWIWGFGFVVLCLGFRVWGFRVWGLGFRVWGSDPELQISQVFLSFEDLGKAGKCYPRVAAKELEQLPIVPLKYIEYSIYRAEGLGLKV